MRDTDGTFRGSLQIGSEIVSRRIRWSLIWNSLYRSVHRSFSYITISYFVAYCLVFFFFCVFIAFIGYAFLSHLPMAVESKAYPLLLHSLSFYLKVQCIVVPLALGLAIFLAHWQEADRLSPLTHIVQYWRRCPAIVQGVFVMACTQGLPQDWRLFAMIAALTFPHLAAGWLHNLKKVPEGLLNSGKALGLSLIHI